MNILYIENEASINSLSFYITAATAANELGWNFHNAYNAHDYSSEKADELRRKHNVYFHQVLFNRNPYSIRNFKAYKQICNLIDEYSIDVIHCNTPIGGVVGRLAGKKCHVNKVIYQAHGFHFFHGAPLINWILYYPIECLLAKYTDILITINHEDYEASKKMKLRNNGQRYYVPGVGMDLLAYENIGVDKASKREELGLKSDAIMLISTGDLIKRKNYEALIKAVSLCNDSRINLFICGRGSNENKLRKLSKQYNVEQQIHFLGFRTDVKELLAVSDMFVFATKQEGLSRSLMEAMASGLPCIASNIRGNVDLINSNEVGTLCNPNDIDSFSRAITQLANDSMMRRRMGEKAKECVRQFDLDSSKQEIKKIYETLL